MKVYPISMVGGVLGLVSLALPWMVVSFGGLSESASGFQMFELQALLGSGGGSVIAGLAGSIWLLVIGVVLAVIGSILSFLHPAGGAVTLAGGACGLAGALWLGSIVSGLVGGFGVSIGPSFGLYMTLGAGIVALAGFVKPIPIGGPSAPAPYPGYPMGAPPYGSIAYPPPYPGYAPSPGGAPTGYGVATPPPPPPNPTPEAAVMTAPVRAGPDPPPLSSAPANPAAEASPSSPPVDSEGLECPICGQRFAGKFCPNDGAALTPGPPRIA